MKDMINENVTDKGLKLVDIAKGCWDSRANLPKGSLSNIILGFEEGFADGTIGLAFGEHIEPSKSIYTQRELVGYCVGRVTGYATLAAGAIAILKIHP
jgi:hypothetical protein